MKLEEASQSSKNSMNLKKRRFRELEKCWELDAADSQSDTLIATSDNTDAFSERSNKRRTIKLQKKIINRVCLEMDLAKSKSMQLPGVKQQTTVTGKFSTIIFELSTDLVSSLHEKDQQAVRE